MTDSTARIAFAPAGQQADVAVGTSLLDAARQLGVDLASVCGGRGLCGRCQVVIPDGAFPQHGIAVNQEGVSAWTASETEYSQRRTLEPGRRLGCYARLMAPLVVEVPPDSRIHRQVVRKRAEVRDFRLDPVVQLLHVRVEPPRLDEPIGDLERLRTALRAEWGVDVRGVDTSVLTGLQSALRSGDWAITVALHDGSDISAIWPGLHEALAGVALDIGSTTIAGHLMDLQTGEALATAGVMNPQIRFGEDLMSRVSYAMLNDGGAAAMTTAVRETINELVFDLCREAAIPISDVLEVVAVANPIMHHLFLGLDPIPLGSAPFTLATDAATRCRAAEVGLTTATGARFYMLPCIAGHVGADAAGVVLSEEPQLSDEVSLLVDVGTNAEIVLGNRNRLLAASSPTGPAFEGAQISSGQRAAPGAIERVRIDPGTLQAKVRVIGTPTWSSEPAFGTTAVTGICGSGIIEAVAEMFLAGILTSDGVIDGQLASRTDRVQAEGRTFSYTIYDGDPPIAVTQNDVRAVQLAKAALHAGCTLLMDHFGVERVDKIRLAGAFGSLIDPQHALVLGLVPDCDVAAVTSAGNAAASGAQIALLSQKARDDVEHVALTIEKVETATEPSFQKRFVSAMAIPHAKDPYDALARSMTLPVPRTSTRVRRRDGARHQEDLA